jgi:hypothetical protein
MVVYGFMLCSCVLLIDAIPEKLCPSFTFEHQTADTNDSTVDTVVTFTCDVSHKIPSPLTRAHMTATCLERGIWSRTIPTCERKIYFF